MVLTLRLFFLQSLPLMMVMMMTTTTMISSSRLLVAADCEDGSVVVYAVGEQAETFGAKSSEDDEYYCVEFCLPEMVLSFVPDASMGNCADQGFTSVVESDKEVYIPGSPMPLSVTILTVSTGTGDTSSSSSSSSMWPEKDPSSYEGPCVDCPEYVDLTGEEKLDRIWSKILAYEYDELPTNWLHKRTNPTSSEMIRNLPDRIRVNMIFDRVSDERPPKFPRMLHEYGSIAKIAFVPATPNGSGFTGLYREGNDHGILRITFCAPFNGERIGQRVPLAFAAKFFRDGIHSSNIPTCEGPDRGWPTRDPQGFAVFQHPLHTTSIIPPPIDDFFALAQNQTGPLSIADNAWHERDGTPVEDPLAPLIVHFFPNRDLITKDSYQEDFRKELPDIPIDTTLYTAYTPVDEEGNPTICICHSTDDGDIPCFNWESLVGTCDMVKLGSIVTKSRFVHSDYGDNGILFKHYRSCQEDRKYCQYNRPIPEDDRTFTKSANLNGTCVSRRRVENYETCPFLNAAKNNENSDRDDHVGLELVATSDYCSTPNEHELEKMCPFAKALHPAFSAHGVPYPLTTEEHLRSCSILATTTSEKRSNVFERPDLPLASIGCCHVINEYFADDTSGGRGSTRDAVLRQLCNMEDCQGAFRTAFPDIALDAECAGVAMTAECKFEIQAGPSVMPVNLGYVTEDCCMAAQTHAGGQNAEEAMKVICEEDSCMEAYGDIFRLYQRFAGGNPADSTNVDVNPCGGDGGLDGTAQEEEEEEADDNSGEKKDDAISRAALNAGIILALVMAVVGLLSFIL